MSMPHKIKLLIVDDHQIFRSGIRELINSIANFEVIAEAENGEDAIKSVRECQPDVVLMDVNMPGIGGLEATKKLRSYFPDLAIIALSSHSNNPFPKYLLNAGASGYLTKDCSVVELELGINTVIAGEQYITPVVAQNLAAASISGKTEISPFDVLSTREMQVVLMVLKGQSNQVISDSLFISPKTVSTYRYRIHEKLNVTGDMELLRLALRYDLADI